MPDFKIPLAELYIGYFGRAPEPDGLTFWEDALEDGFTLLAAAQDFGGQAETLAEYPYLADPTTNDLEAFLTTVYANLFNREPDAAGLTFWVEAIEGGLPLGTAILSIIQGATGDDIAILQNKVDLACAWHDLAESEPDFELTPAAIASSREALALVTSDPDSVAEAAAATGANETFFNDAPLLEVTPILTELPEDADTSARIKVADIAVTDDDLGTNILSLSGADAALFEVDGTELFLSAGSALDFETLAALDVTVEVDDAAIETAPEDSVDLTLSITDVNEAPSVTLTPVVTTLGDDADTTAAIKIADIVVNDDGLGTNDLTLAGDDAALFEIVGTELFLRAGTTIDALGNASLDVEVVLDDAAVGASPDDSAALAISVTESNTVPGLALTPVLTELAEDADTTARIKVADLAITDDGNGTNTLTLTGTDAALFELDGVELFLKAGTALDFESDVGFDVTVEVDDAGVGSSPDASQVFALSITDVNEAPNVSLTPVISTLGEDAETTVRIKVADIAISDDGLGTNVLSLSGADAALFEIDGTELFLTAGAALDFETLAALDVAVEVDDAAIEGAPEDSVDLTLSITDVNEAPSVTLTPVVMTLGDDADTTVAIKVADIVVIDDAIGTNDLTLSGADATLVEIVGAELFLRAGITLDGLSNASLDVEVLVDDAGVGATPDDSAALAISVTESNTVPGLSLTPVLTALAEDADTAARIKVGDLAITDDGNGTNTLTLTGADAALFELDDLELFLKAGTPLDFELDAGLDVTVNVDDAGVGSSPDASQAFTLSITDVNEAPGVSLSPVLSTLAEDVDTTARIKVADIAISDDGLGNNDLSLTGSDAALFEIDGAELFLKAGASLDFETQPILDVSVVLDDVTVGGTPDATVPLSFGVTDANEAPSVALTPVVTELAEDADTSAAIKVADITITDDALGTNDLMLSGADAALFEIVGTELFLKAGAALDFETAANLDVTVEVDDAGVGSSPDDTAVFSLAVTDVNEAPDVTLTPVISELAEDADTAAALKVADITVSDDALGTNNLTLSGADAVLFEIIGTELFLKADAALDFEGNPNLDVTVEVDDADVGTNPDGSDKLSIAITDVNEPLIALVDMLSTSEFRVNSFLGFDQADPAITTLANGNVVILWRSDVPEQGDADGSGIKGRIFDATGGEFTSEFLVNGGTSGDQTLPAVTALPGGGFVVAWEAPEGADTGIEARIFAADGTASGGDIALNSNTSGDQNMPDLTPLPGGGFVAVWGSDTPGQGDSDGAGIKARVFDAAGAEVEAEALVNSLTTGDQMAPAIAALTDGSLAVVWTTEAPSDGDTSGTAIKARLIAEDGSEVVAEFLVNARTNGLQGAPEVTALAGGGFAVTWESYDGQDGDSSSLAVKGRIFDATGTATSSELLINNATIGFQREVDVTALAGGGFVATWASQDRGQGDSSVTAISARVFNADGSERVPEFRVNEAKPRAQETPVVTALADGGFVIAWASDDRTDGDISGSAIKARRFDADGAPQDAPRAVSEDTPTTFTVAELLDNDGDPDGDDITLIELAGAGTGGSTSEGATVTLNGDGTITYDPSGVAAFDALTPGQTATDSFTYTIEGAGGETAQATVTVLIEGGNDAPEVNLSNTTTDLLNTVDTATRVKVADFTVTDDGAGVNGLSLTGDDAGLFEIDGTELFLKAGTGLDANTNPSLDVTIEVNDAAIGIDPDDSDELSIAVINANDPATVTLTPVITSFAEDQNTAARIKMADIAIADDGLGTNTVGLSGADAALFEIDGTELFLIAGAALDFEINPALDVAVTVDDPEIPGAPDIVAALQITVTDVNDEPPVFTSGATANAAENQTAAYTSAVTDPDGGALSYALGGTDAALFDIVANTGVVTFKGSPNFETPSDDGGDNVYDIIVTVSDSVQSTNQNVAIKVMDLNEAPTAMALSDTSAPENVPGAVVGTLTTTDEDAGETFTYTIQPGPDASLFSIVGDELRIGGGGLDAESSLSRFVNIRSTDGSGNIIEETFTINVLDSVEQSLTVGDDVIAPTNDDLQLIGTGLTLTPGDDLDGGGGMDTLLLVSGAAYATFDLDAITGFANFEEVRFVLDLNGGSYAPRAGTSTDVVVTGSRALNIIDTPTAAIGELVGGDGGVYVGQEYSQLSNVEITNFTGGFGGDRFFLSATNNSLMKFNGGDGHNVLDYRSVNGMLTEFISGSQYDELWYYGTTGTLARVETGGDNDRVYLQSVTALAPNAVLDGGAGTYDEINFSTQNEIIDLSTINITGFEQFSQTTSGTALVDTTTVAPFTRLSSGTYLTGEATLDLTGIQVSSGSVESSNVTGTIFDVDRSDTALRVIGGLGDDTLRATTLTFSQAERDAIFLTTSIETIIDATGTFGNNDANVLTAPLNGGLMEGAGGDDQLISGIGADFLRGGQGNDTFSFLVNSGLDQILDFVPGDKIDVSALGFTNFATLSTRISDDGVNTTIDFDGGVADVDEVTVLGAVGLVEADFTLV